MKDSRYTFDIHRIFGETYCLIEDKNTGEVREVTLQSVDEVLDDPKGLWSRAKRVDVKPPQFY